VPNYFDDQRFGSLGESGQFIAESWCRGDYERTIWLAIAEPNARDSSHGRDDKRLLREHWGDWRRCRELLRAPDRQKIAAFLDDQRGDFRRAIALVRQDQRSLWLAAYQSHLWNRILATVLHQTCRPEQLALQTIAQSAVPFYQSLDADQAALLKEMFLPLPSARLHLESEPLRALYDRVLAEAGTALRQIRVKYPRDSFFSKGERPALFQPREVQAAPDADELYPGRRKLTLRFALPRGSYATILIKRLTGMAADELADGGSDDG
jgi:tRNA pseudouridine13 synthase